jgi:hypothetical protein
LILGAFFFIVIIVIAKKYVYKDNMRLSAIFASFAFALFGKII